MVGTFVSGYPIISAAFTGWALWITWNTKRPPPKAGLLLSGAIYLTSIGSVQPLMPIAMGTIVLSLFIIARHVRTGWDTYSFVLGMIAGSAIQMYAAITTWGDVRPPLLSLNASQVAQTGLVFWIVLPELKKPEQWYAWLPAAVHMGVSLARVPLAAAVIYFFSRPSKPRAFMLAGIIAVFFSSSTSQGLLSRVLPESLADKVSERIGMVINPAETTVALTGGKSDELIPKVEYAEFEWNGYGVGNYVTETGLIRPHNIFVLVFYQMGVLAIVPVFLFGWAVFARKIPLSVFLALFFLWQFTEEAIGRVEGFFTTAAVLVAVWRSRPATNSLLAATRRRLLPARLQGR